jgi:hypothetical protein
MFQPFELDSALRSELTTATTTTQSSHQIPPTMYLEVILKNMTGNVIAVLIMTTHMISLLRDGCGTPLQIRFCETLAETIIF